jgi:hypothetical protein
VPLQGGVGEDPSSIVIEEQYPFFHRGEHHVLQFALIGRIPLLAFELGLRAGRLIAEPSLFRASAGRCPQESETRANSRAQGQAENEGPSGHLVGSVRAPSARSPRVHDAFGDGSIRGVTWPRRRARVNAIGFNHVHDPFTLSPPGSNLPSLASAPTSYDTASHDRRGQAHDAPQA